MASASPDGASWLSSSLSYDDKDNLVASTDPLGNIERFSYADNGMDLVAHINAKGVCTSNTHDTAGNLIQSVEDAAGLCRTTTNAYNTAGQRITATDPLGRSTYSFYSQGRTPGQASDYATIEPSAADSGWLVATRDPEGRVTTYAYDALGRQTRIDSPGNGPTNRYVVANTYDNMDRLTSTLFPDGTYVSNFYVNGYPVATRDRAGRRTTMSYDAAGHVKTLQYPNSNTVSKTYIGNLVSVLTDGRKEPTHFYYDHEQLVGVEFPDNSKRAAGFDNLNRQIWAVDERGVAVTTAYDALGRLVFSQYMAFDSSLASLDQSEFPPFDPAVFTCDTSNIYPAESLSYSVSRSYDVLGNVVGIVDWTGSTSNGFDNLKRCLYQASSIEHLGSSLDLILTNAYDLMDKALASSVCINGQPEIMTRFEYDNLDRIIALTNDAYSISATYCYNPNGKLASMGVWNGNTLVNTNGYLYDTENRLTGIVNKCILSFRYGYNSAQQITGLV